MLKTVLIDESMRRRIVEFVQPTQRDYFSYQNLNLLTAIYDDVHDFYLVQTYFLSECIKRCGDDFDDVRYAVIMKDNIFSVSGFRYRSGGVSISPQNLPLRKGILTLAALYEDENYREYTAVTAPLKAQGVDIHHFTENYLKEHFW